MAAFLGIAGRYALLTKNEEIHLGRRVQRWLRWDEESQGPCPPSVVRSGQKARERFILCNLRLVAKVCKGYTRRLHGTGLSFEDILHEGVVGLARAAEKYDPECGYAMSTYATWWIRQAVSRALESKGNLIKIGTTPRRNLYKLQRLVMEGMPVAQAAEQLGINERQLELVQCASAGIRIGSLDAAIDSGLSI
jgi:DNA-directed RNA polymerase sigma subunit (sigma70/sigma32)